MVVWSSSGVPEIADGDLDLLGDPLGAGSYGAVYKAKWKSNKMIVAAKKVFVLQKEAEILSKCKHKNIILFYGLCRKAHNFWIVTEFAEKGSLSDYLLNDGNPNLTFDWMCKWAIDIAQGMDYLHCHAVVQVVHRDVKSRNIVISADDICKLCDFGSGKTLSETSATMSAAGTPAYMSPEMIEGRATSSATDVWSYGVVLWELLTREVPFEGLNFFQVGMLVSEGTRLSIPSTCSHGLAHLIRDCWAKEPEARPNSEKVLERVRFLSRDQQVSVEMRRFLDEKDKWIQEIETQKKMLKNRETDLMAREAAIRREERHRPYPLDRTTAPCDINEWDEIIVVKWLYSLHLGLNREELEKLANLIHDHHISGSRLLMITEKDMQHMGIESVGIRTQLMHIIDQEKKENVKLIEFPPLGSTNHLKSNGTAALQLVEQQLQATLLLGYIYYQDENGGIWWKVFVDSFQNDQVAGLIKEVQFLVPSLKHQEPMKTRGFGQLPLASDHYLNIDLNDLCIDCIVYFTDSVIKPRNTRIIRTITHPATQIVTKKLQLTIRKDKTRGSHVQQSPSHAPHLQGDWTSPLISHHKAPSPPPSKKNVGLTPSKSLSAIANSFRHASAPTPSPEVYMTSSAIRSTSDDPHSKPHFSLSDESSVSCEDESGRPRANSAATPAVQQAVTPRPSLSSVRGFHSRGTRLALLRLPHPGQGVSNGVNGTNLSSKFSDLSMKGGTPATPPPLLPQPFSCAPPLETVQETKKEKLYEMKPRRKNRRRKVESIGSESTDGCSKYSTSVHGGNQKMMWKN